ncbi:hypothetical protein J2772_000896 [Chryseobacterium jejuense]|nr:hypothetical protein [Chryseobacterium jejuense]
MVIIIFKLSSDYRNFLILLTLGSQRFLIKIEKDFVRKGILFSKGIGCFIAE